jgi:hypothetical protein
MADFFLTEGGLWRARERNYGLIVVWASNVPDVQQNYLNEVDLRSRISVKSIEIGVATLRQYSASREHCLK